MPLQLQRRSTVRYHAPSMANDEAALAAAQPSLAERAAPERPVPGVIAQAGYLIRAVRPRQWTKNGIVVLLDLMVIAAGFVLRAMAGALAIDVPISPWLYVVTALGALFLGINKRRAELELLQDGASNHRKILDEYSPELLDQMASTVTAATLMPYGLYTFTAEGLPAYHSMTLTIQFVLSGIFRFLYLG